MPVEGTFRTASADGRRIVTWMWSEKPGDPAQLCRERFIVYDLERRRAIGSFETDELHGAIAGSTSSGIALSPNGMTLAVRSGSKLQLIHLP